MTVWRKTRRTGNEAELAGNSGDKNRSLCTAGRTVVGVGSGGGLLGEGGLGCWGGGGGSSYSSVGQRPK